MGGSVGLPRLLTAVTASSPALLLGLVGLTHPDNITPENAGHWHDLHVGLLVLFPLLALPLCWLVRAEALAIVGAVSSLSFLYAVFYGAQDAIVGIGLGAIVDEAQSPSDVATISRAAASGLVSEANQMARIGLWCFLGAAVIASLAIARRYGVRAVPGAVLLCAAAISFLESHVYWPRGVLTMFGFAAAFAALALAPQPPAAAAGAGRATKDKPTRAQPKGSSRKKR